MNTKQIAIAALGLSDEDELGWQEIFGEDEIIAFAQRCIELSADANKKHADGYRHIRAIAMKPRDGLEPFVAFSQLDHVYDEARFDALIAKAVETGETHRVEIPWPAVDSVKQEKS